VKALQRAQQLAKEQGKDLNEVGGGACDGRVDGKEDGKGGKTMWCRRGQEARHPNQGVGRIKGGVVAGACHCTFGWARIKS
jgi:hypothetical protein